MPHDDPPHEPLMPAEPGRPPREAYEPPRVEDLDSAEGPAVTAAGATTTTKLSAAPRTI
jgi:hypothetical protein